MKSETQSNIETRYINNIISKFEIIICNILDVRHIIYLFYSNISLETDFKTNFKARIASIDWFRNLVCSRPDFIIWIS